MTHKKDKIKIFVHQLPKNIFSGFVVSLIALPLGLGLAMASDAPPISGIVTAIVGGIVVSILGGSHVTITGPGNGLVGVTIVTIAALGLNDAYVAIVCSGIFVFALGLFKMGKLSDFFPSSAIQGMLAAIGLIILGKQFHIMLGHRIQRDNAFDYLVEIPQTIINILDYRDKGLMFAAGIGILSLIIMIYYPKIRNRYFQLLPAPVWIVLISIGLSYYYELLGLPNPVDPSYMMPAVPDIVHIFSELPSIRFNNIGSLPFWSSVFALTLISSIESLLSIKAVDKLDPDKRRSNVNKDLKALGIATVGSGILGGLNVVTVIARSSINVNHGGSNRSSNFFHALFLLSFIALFTTQLTRIALPSLMAILVYTGYKLASPEIIRKTSSIGKEQLLIFFITLFSTLKFGLISGISLGVVTTLLVHFVIAKNLSLFLKNWFKPNVLMFKEGSLGNNYYVSVKHFCSFFNFYRLKQKLEVISEDSDVIVDFSMCEFVDHSVMENLNYYQDLFRKKGGHFEVMGLDTHNADSKHPFALRRLLPVSKFLEKNLTKRQISISVIADDFNMNYSPVKHREIEFLNPFLFFKTKQVNTIYNQLIDPDESLRVFDMEFSEGEFIAKEVVRITMLHLKLPSEIPAFTLDREGFWERVYTLAGFKDIKIEGHKDFSNRFCLIGEDEEAIKAFFSDDIVLFFESNPYYHIESNGTDLIMFSKERLAGVKEIKALLDYGRRFKHILLNRNQSS